jgi:hypothetical protein
MKAALLLRDFLWQRAREGHRMENTYFVTEVSGAGSDVSLPFSEFVEVGALDVMAISQVNTPTNHPSPSQPCPHYPTIAHYVNFCLP